MTVIGVGRSALGDPDLGEVRASSDLLSLLPNADYVIVAAPLTEESRGMDAVAFARMKQSARLINTGRGPIVVEEDLAQPCRRNGLAGAALDVFREPLPHDHPLWAVPNLLISRTCPATSAVGWTL